VNVCVCVCVDGCVEWVGGEGMNGFSVSQQGNKTYVGVGQGWVWVCWEGRGTTTAHSKMGSTQHTHGPYLLSLLTAMTRARAGSTTTAPSTSSPVVNCHFRAPVAWSRA
jgi:hypothetical protein